MTETPQTKYRGFIAWMAQNSVAVNLLMIMVMGAGLLSLSTIRQETFPDFNLDIISVSVPYPGATPEEIEGSIILALEESVRAIEGVKRVSGTAAENIGVVTLELTSTANPDSVLANVKAAVDRIPTLPQNAENPEVALISQRARVASVVISGDAPISTLESIAEDVRVAVVAHPDISQAEVTGVPPHELKVTITREKMHEIGLTAGEIARRIGAGSRELSGGGLKTNRGDILLRVTDRKKSAAEFGALTIASSPQGSRVLLSHIATIEDGYEENDQSNFFNGQRSSRVDVYRVGEESTLAVSAAIKTVLAKQRTTLPNSINVDIWNDESGMLQGRIDLLTKNALNGLILVVLILALFLEIRLAFWVALGIPISFLGAFAIMPLLGLSINMITLFALIITLGMVVDDAIIVGENAYEKMSQGMPKRDAAILGAREMATPVTFAILTTIAAFSPLFFIPGVMGKFFSIMPAVVVAVLLFSLLEGFFILPAHLAHVSTKPLTGAWAVVDKPRLWATAKMKACVAGPYDRIVRLATQYRYATVSLAVSSLMVAVGLLSGGIIPFNFFPSIEGDIITVNGRMPFGTSHQRVVEMREVLEESLNETTAHFGTDYVRGLYTRLGEQAGGGPGGFPTVSPNLLSLEVSLVEAADRPFSSKDFADYWNQATAPIPGVQGLSFGANTGPGANAALTVRLSHANAEAVNMAAQDLVDEMLKYSDLTNVDSTLSNGKPRLDFHLRPEAASLGLTSTNIGEQVRGAFYGAEALREQQGRHERRVMVRLPDAQRGSLFDIEKFMLKTPANALVPLSTVAYIDKGFSPSAITRRDGMRTVDVSADLSDDVPSPTPVMISISDDTMEMLTERYPGLYWTYSGLQQEQADTFASLGPNYLIALMAIFALLAIPLRSYSKPLIVMSAIPFGLAGAIFGHLLLGYSMSVISMFGVIALSGVVVNDSLVLVDSSNRFAAQGLTPNEAIIAACKRRFRPITLTSLTTFFGLMPMIFEPSMQAQFLVPMAISLGFGILFATLIVLLVVPSIFMIIEDVKSAPRALFVKFLS